MRKSITILMTVLALVISADLGAKKTKELIETPASDSRIEYTGRTLVEGSDVTYDWSGVYFRVKFTGPYLAMKCSDTHNCWFNLWIDKEMSPKTDKIFMVGEAKDTLIVLAEGLGNTLAITALALLLGILLGIVTSLVRIVHDKTDKLYYLDKIVKLYVSAIRGTPVMVQLLIIYFVLLLPVGIEKFPAAVLCFGLNSGAYVSEIIRGGIMSIDNGQFEAGRSLGFSYFQTMRYIVIPQTIKSTLPTLLNELIALFKETSIAGYGGILDLTKAGERIRGVTFTAFMPLIAVALIYLVVVMIFTALVRKLERRLRNSDH